MRAYQGARRIAKTHVPRLKFPAPATVETWVSDAAGDPLLVVMVEPAASLAAELRWLIPELRHRRRRPAGASRVRPGGWCLEPESLMELGQQELRLQIGHGRTEATVRSAAERDEGQVRSCGDDVLVVEPRRVMAVGV
jgi:hypothetical protein